jgi:3'-phosphoadenosine 5'-phosphosulfate sulfotransferase (PAPS reductase)/FAD synthetase
MNRDAIYRRACAAQYGRVQSDAHAIIAQAIAQAGGGLVACGVSGGKDSVAMLHLVLQHCRPAVIFNDSGLETPEARPIVEGLCQRFGLDLHVAQGDAVELAAAGEDTNKAIFGPVTKTLREIGAALEFVGLRSAESKRRRMVIGRLGPIYASKRFGCLIAWPMRQWTAADVFAYLDEHDLPMHPAYARASDEQRDSVRVSWAYDPDRERHGEAEFTRRTYPELYRKLKELGIIR